MLADALVADTRTVFGFVRTHDVSEPALAAWTDATERLDHATPAAVAAYRRAFSALVAGPSSPRSAVGGGGTKGWRKARRTRRGGADRTRSTSRKSPRKSRKSRKSSHASSARNAPTDAPGSLLQRAWRAFLDGLAYAGTLLVTAPTKALQIIKQVATVLGQVFQGLIRVLFAPLTGVAYLVRWGMRAGVHLVARTYQTLFTVVMLALVMCLCIDPNATLKGQCPASAQPHIDKHAGSVRAIWTKACVPLFALVTRGIPQMTYDLLRVWHLTLGLGANVFVDALFAPAGRWAQRLFGKALHDGTADAQPTGWKHAAHQYRERHGGNDPLANAFTKAWDRVVGANAAKGAKGANEKGDGTDAAAPTKWSDATADAWKQVVRRYVKGDVETMNDVRVLRVGEAVAKMGTDLKNPLDEMVGDTVGRVVGDIAPAQVLKLGKSTRKWADKQVGNYTVYTLLTWYLLSVGGGPGLQGAREGYASVMHAQNAGEVVRAYETLGVAAVM